MTHHVSESYTHSDAAAVSPIEQFVQSDYLSGLAQLPQMTAGNGNNLLQPIEIVQPSEQAGTQEDLHSEAERRMEALRDYVVELLASQPLNTENGAALAEVLSPFARGGSLDLLSAVVSYINQELAKCGLKLEMASPETLERMNQALFDNGFFGYEAIAALQLRSRGEVLGGVIPILRRREGDDI